MKIKAKPKETIKEIGKEITEVDGKIARKEASEPEKESEKKKTTVSKRDKIAEKIRRTREEKGSVEPRYESWNDEINEVSLKLANRFTHNELHLSVSDPSEAPEVYGYLRENYRNFKWLIDNYVCEVAVWYSKNKLDRKIQIVRIIDNIDIDKYKWSRVELDGVHRFENYPNVPFVNIIFLCEEFLDDAVYWLEDSEWILEGEEVRVNLGRFSGALLAWTSWNVPVILVTHLPFKNIGVYKAKMNAKQIYKIQEDMKLKLINTYRTVIDSYDDQLDQQTREAKNWKKMYSDLSKKYGLEYRRLLAKMEAKQIGQPVQKNTVNIFLIMIILILGVLSVVGLMT